MSLERSQLSKLWQSDDELFALAQRELFTCVVGDVMDKLDLQHQFLPPQIQPLRRDMVVIGRAMPVLAVDVFAEKIAGIASHFTRHFPAVHMTWGAINEMATLTGYHAVIDRTRHPMLTTILTRIIKDERRHFSFYYNQARRMLQDPAARRLTSFLVRHFWTPVGAPVRGDADAHRMCAFLFPTRESAEGLMEMDAMIARLPGLEWFDMAMRFCFVADDRSSIGSLTAHQAV